MQVIAGNHRQKAALHLIVREVEQEHIHFAVVVLNRQITALVNHRQRIFRVSLVVDKLIQRIFPSRQFVNPLVEVVHQPNQVSGRTGGEPKVADSFIIKGIEYAKRIVNIRHIFAEMIAIVLLFQLQFHFLFCTILSLRHFAYGFSELRVQFFLGNATQCLKFFGHTDVQWLVESTEHADLRELGDTRQEHKAEVGICFFECRIKAFQDFAVVIEQFRVHFQYIEQGFVVLVNQHHCSMACLFSSHLQDFFQPKAKLIPEFSFNTIFLFPL